MDTLLLVLVALRLARGLPRQSKLTSKHRDASAGGTRMPAPRVLRMLADLESAIMPHSFDEDEDTSAHTLEPRAFQIWDPQRLVCPQRVPKCMRWLCMRADRRLRLAVGKELA